MAAIQNSKELHNNNQKQPLVTSIADNPQDNYPIIVSKLLRGLRQELTTALTLKPSPPPPPLPTYLASRWDPKSLVC